MFDWVLNTPVKFKTKTTGKCHSRCSGAIIGDIEHISHVGFHAYFTYFIHISQNDILPLFIPNK